MSKVVFGFGTHPGIEDGPGFLRLVQQADQDGLDLFSLSDHPYLGDRLEAYAGIAFLLGATRRIAGFANVTSLPTRPAPMLARTVVSLAALSGGRVVLGVGAGGRLDRVTEVGAPRLSPGEAVAALEESIVLMRGSAKIWTGSVGPRSLAVTGRVADGWIPGHAADWLSPRYRESRPIIDQAAASAGRDPREVVTIFNFPGRVTDRPLRSTRDAEGRWVGGSVEQWVEELTGAIIEHAASGFMLFSPTGGTADPETLRRWATEIVPAVRAATAR
jgi:alkanesulfonate monooxygenase SsuD/methylene tetrahydromethanopterin reductase-like flavin-dependent oxidoreductase (luciferase family)